MCGNSLTSRGYFVLKLESDWIFTFSLDERLYFASYSEFSLWSKIQNGDYVAEQKKKLFRRKFQESKLLVDFNNLVLRLEIFLCNLSLIINLN